MKKNYILRAMTLSVAVVFALNLNAQFYTNQLIVGNGGIYGDPSDHVTVSAYNPDGQTTTSFGDIQRESIQDLIIHGNYAYVAAEDSIVKFNIDTYEKVAAVYESNLNQLFCKNGLLYVSRRSDINGPPADGVYLKVFNAGDLALVGSVNGISGDANGIVVESDTVYLAVSGDWQATEGKFAVIDNSFNLVREMDFGADAVGIFDLYSDGNNIYSVNRSPYGSMSGSVSTYSIWTTLFTTTVFDNVVGKGVAKSNNALYLMLDNGIGSYDLGTNEVLETSIVPDPGSSDFIYIADAAFDYLNQLFYVTLTDYFSMGEGKIYDMEGTETGTFDAEVSAEAVALDFRINDFAWEDVEYWIGEGGNKALFVVDWNDGTEPESIAWGFRFEGETTGEEMLTAIAEADDRLTINMAGGFLNDIIYSNGYAHEGIGGTNGFYWATYSGINSGNWSMNAGLSTSVSNGDWFGCSFTDFDPAIVPGVPVAVSNPLGVQVSEVPAIHVFPNPFNDKIQIEAQNISEVKVLNMNGKLLYQNKLNGWGSSRIDLSGLPKGMYILQMISEKEMKVERIIKQ
ncbi:MAG: T9SS type A sorting domain-containing protein [Chlorobi bacterium]|nr:T9SS type A sorting domain-containing protein [Chlorobiota bacterium]